MILSVRRMAVVFAVGVMSCVTTPTGRKELHLLPESQMSQMGVAAFAELKKGTPIDDDPSRNALVRCVADSIVSVLPKGEDRTGWEIVVFKDDTPNAFALPGKKIGVHSGMLEIARNESRLATVIGHEVGHVLAGHGNARISTSLATESGLALIAALTSPQGAADNRKSQLILGLLGLGAEVGVLLPFSRAEEREADRIGLDLMARAGFNPQESIELWKSMERPGKGQPPQFLSTHPSHGSRIDDLRSRMIPAMALYEDARSSGRTPRCAREAPVATNNE